MLSMKISKRCSWLQEEIFKHLIGLSGGFEDFKNTTEDCKSIKFVYQHSKQKEIQFIDFLIAILLPSTHSQINCARGDQISLLI